MRIERRKATRAKLIFCHNGCRRNMDRIRKTATHIAWLIGRPTYLCPACANEWQRIWAELTDAEGAQGLGPVGKSRPRSPAPPERQAVVA